MVWLLNGVYLALLVVVAPRLLWQSWRHGKYRQGWAAKIWGQVPALPPRPRVWFHAVSVGEVQLLAPVLKALQQQAPELELVVSTTTRTGYELARRRYADLVVFYAPLDFSWAVRRALRRVQPTLLVLAELELWPNLITFADRSGVPVAIMNGRLGEKSAQGYRRVRPLISRILRKVAWIGAQDATIAARFTSLGASDDSLEITGSVKFDGAEIDRLNGRTQQLASLLPWPSSSIVWLVGSTQDPEESLALDVFARLAVRYPELKLILVPRHAERFDSVVQLAQQKGLPTVRRTQLGPTSMDPTSARRPVTPRVAPMATTPQSPPTPHSPPPTSSPANAHPPADTRTTSGTPSAGSKAELGGASAREALPSVLVVDTIGELGAWWGTAHIGFVGGSLTQRGGQNMIEPAAYGVATCFGPHTHNFRDIVSLLRAAESCEVIQGEVELEAFVERCVRDAGYRQQLGDRGRAVVLEHRGATRRTVTALLKILAETQQRRAGSAEPAAPRVHQPVNSNTDQPPSSGRAHAA